MTNESLLQIFLSISSADFRLLVSEFHETSVITKYEQRSIFESFSSESDQRSAHKLLLGIMSQKSEHAMGIFLAKLRVMDTTIVAFAEAPAGIGGDPKLQQLKRQVEEVQALASLQSKLLKT